MNYRVLVVVVEDGPAYDTIAHAEGVVQVETVCGCNAEDEASAVAATLAHSL